MFIASTRQGERGADAEKASSDGAHYSLATLTLPPGHKSGAIEKPMWGSPNTRDHIVVQSVRELDADEFHNELASHISGRIGVNRDVLVYVHGYNTSFEDARLTAAQIAADAKIGGVAVLFTWPSKAQLFGYVSDKDAAMASRDALQQLFTDLSETPGVGKIHVLAHSMGGWLAMEALRQEAIAGKRDLNGRLGEVMLAAPDIDMDVFASQMAKLSPRMSPYLRPTRTRRCRSPARSPRRGSGSAPSIPRIPSSGKRSNRWGPKSTISPTTPTASSVTTPTIRRRKC